MALAKKSVSKSSTKAVAKSTTFSFQYVHNNVVLTDSMDYTPLSIDTLASHSNSGASINKSITSALMLGKALQFNSGSDYLKFLNSDKKNYISVYKKDKEGNTVMVDNVPVIESVRRVSRDDVNSTYLLLDVAKSVFKLSNNENLVKRWNDYTTQLIAERNAINVENAKRKASGEPLLANTKVPAPTPSGILKMLKGTPDVDHALAFVKCLKTAYNHALEMKGKQAQQDAEKVAALIVANGGEI
jgi:hypothetical protein